MDGTVLVADDDRTIRTVLTQAFTRAGCKVHATSSLTTLMRWVSEGIGDLVITDVVMPDGNGLEMLPEIHNLRKDLPVIVISAQNTIMTAIKATEAKAFDYLPKPFDLPDLMKRAGRALASKSTREPRRNGITSATNELPLVGQSDVMQDLYRLIAKVVNGDLPVLINGESGTGKSLIARILHDFSDRRARPFVVVSAADLMTYDRVEQMLARAGTGTLLFDAVADFEPETQSIIVRIMDRMGDESPRIIATTQADLSVKMAAGEFRQDLFYRLNGVGLAIPALRDRVQDIALLTDFFLGRADTPLRLSSEAAKLMQRYSWPGNVRQLENCLMRLSVTSAQSEISLFEVEQALGGQPAQERMQSGQGNKLSDSIARHLKRYFDLHGGALPPPGLYPRILHEMERPLLEIALESTGGNQAKCAVLLGINRNTLRKKITALDIRVTRRRKLV